MNISYLCMYINYLETESNCLVPVQSIKKKKKKKDYFHILILLHLLYSFNLLEAIKL